MPPGRGRAPRVNCRFFDTRRRNPAIDGLSSGGNRIRTFGPAPAKGSSGRCQSETSARKAEPLKVQARDGDACPERLPVACPFAEGPRVRIRLPPAQSQERTYGALERFPTEWLTIRRAHPARQDDEHCSKPSPPVRQIPRVAPSPATILLDEVVHPIKRRTADALGRAHRLVAAGYLACGFEHVLRFGCSKSLGRY